MTTTKQHFELTARIIKGRIKLHEFHNKNKIAALEEIALDFAQEFAAINPLFNRDRFLKACNVSDLLRVS